MMSYWFSTWRPRRPSATYGFVFDDITCLLKVKIYLETKLRRHISIHGWDRTTSGLEKQTSAILEFNSSSFCDFDQMAVICVPFCIKLPNFAQIGHPRRSDDVIYNYKMAATMAHYYLLYIYFRFRKINVRHIGILLPVATSTISQSYVCYSASGYQISSKSSRPRQSNAVIYNFNISAAAAQYYFRLRIWWYHSLQKVKIYPYSKFRRHILMHSWYITTSDLEKEKSAILEF